MELEVLQAWPGWKAVRLIGEGSFGKVYEIVRNYFGIEEHSALKVISIPPSSAELKSLKNDGMDESSATEYYRGLVDEFVQEISLMSKLKGSAHIVGYEDYAVVKHPNSFGWDILIRMELLTDLPSYLLSREVTQPLVARMAAELCAALEECRREGVIHRDIKPDNIFVTKDGSFKLGDFGVARTIEKTASGLSKKGTYTYMAPEVYRGEAYGASVDLYSLGIVVYKLLNHNREPFLPPYPQPIHYSDKNQALVRRINGEMLTQPDRADAAMFAVIRKACAADPAERYASATEMKRALLALPREAKPSPEQAAPEPTQQEGTVSIFGAAEPTAPKAAQASAPEHVLTGQPTARVSEPEALSAEPTAMQTSTVAVQAPPAEPEQTGKTKRCAQCGTMNFPSATFCLHCGGRFAAKAPEKRRKDKQDVLRWTSFLTALAAGALFLIAIFIMLDVGTEMRSFESASSAFAARMQSYLIETSFGILLALCAAFSKPSSKAMPLSKLFESASDLVTFVFGVAAYGATDASTLRGLVFCLLGCAGSILWMTLRGKRWIGGAMIAAEMVFFADYVYKNAALGFRNAGMVFFSDYVYKNAVLGLRNAGAVRMIGMLFLAVSFLTKSLVKRENAPKPKQVDKKLFWILAIVINAIDLLDFFANL